MTKILKIYLEHTLLLAILFLFTEWLFFESSIQIIKNIPGTDIKIFGLVILIEVILILNIAFKKSIEKYDSFKVLSLTILGSVICCSAVISLQTFRVIMNLIHEENINLIDKAIQTCKLVLILGIISFLIAFRIITKKTEILLLMILGIFIITGLIMKYS